MAILGFEKIYFGFANLGVLFFELFTIRTSNAYLLKLLLAIRTNLTAPRTETSAMIKHDTADGYHLLEITSYMQETANTVSNLWE